MNPACCNVFNTQKNNFDCLSSIINAAWPTTAIQIPAAGVVRPLCVGAGALQSKMCFQASSRCSAQQANKSLNMTMFSVPSGRSSGSVAPAAALDTDTHVSAAGGDRSAHMLSSPHQPTHHAPNSHNIFQHIATRTATTNQHTKHLAQRAQSAARPTPITPKSWCRELRHPARPCQQHDVVEVSDCHNTLRACWAGLLAAAPSASKHGGAAATDWRGSHVVDCCG